MHEYKVQLHASRVGVSINVKIHMWNFTQLDTGVD